MSNEKARSYEVLAQMSGVDAGAAYLHLGTVNAGDADAAIARAVQDGGLPREDGGRVVAIPTSNWNARDVTIRQEPVVDVLPLAGEQAELGGGES